MDPWMIMAAMTALGAISGKQAGDKTDEAGRKKLAAQNRFNKVAPYFGMAPKFDAYTNVAGPMTMQGGMGGLQSSLSMLMMDKLLGAGLFGGNANAGATPIPLPGADGAGAFDPNLGLGPTQIQPPSPNYFPMSEAHNRYWPGAQTPTYPTGGQGYASFMPW